MAGQTFHKVLVANRGEIACRVIGSARACGYATVAVYSEADRHARHVRLADEAVRLGPPQAAESYLNIQRIIEAARATGADAVHPGYGFLAENAEFVEACHKAGLVFIGPSAEAMRLMGHKAAAKRRMIEAGVPCVPGYQEEDQDPGRLRKEAERIGYPVLIKAAAGGGGRGMRLVENKKDFGDALDSARSEARNAFGDDTLILERAVQSPRHVEVQVFADTHGNVIHLGERDCSVQRRHQKVIEEAPGPGISEKLRAAMGEAACQAARAIDYTGAGTVEFLLDAGGEFFFMEMNTRLQVEHPVTELVTGQDLVAWQLAVAEGGELPLRQEQVVLQGHAMEARLYAEDPAQDFMPQTGRVLRWRLPQGLDVRVDHGVHEGGEITPHYDPMIAKVITYGASRDEARRKLVAALRRIELLGVVHNRDFLARVCDHPAFAAGEVTTAFIAEHMGDDASMSAPAPDEQAWALAALTVYLARAGDRDPASIGWRGASQIDSLLRLVNGETDQLMAIRAIGRGHEAPAAWQVSVSLDMESETPEEPLPVTIEVLDHVDGVIVYMIGNVRRRLVYEFDGEALHLQHADREWRFEDVTHLPPEAVDAAGTGILTAPLDGSVIEVLAGEGDQVEQGQVVMVVEAMKMEHQIRADIDGVLSSLKVGKGDQVKPRQVVAEIEGKS